jgi:excisionase family DNA binding protein
MSKNKEKSKKFLSTIELAQMLGVSRIAVFKKIKEGKIEAEKIGRNYAIPTKEFGRIVGLFVSENKKREIDRIVKKAAIQYEKTLQLLGKE